MKKIIPILVISVSFLLACKKNQGTGSTSTPPTGTTGTGKSDTASKDTLLAPYFFKTDVNGVTRNFTRGAALIVLDTVPLPTNDLEWILTITAYLPQTNNLESMIQTATGFEQVSSISTDLSDLVHSYSAAGSHPGYLSYSFVDDVFTGTPLAFTKGYACDSLSNGVSQTAFQLNITSFTSTEIKGNFSGLLLKLKDYPNADASESITNGQFDLPVTLGR